MRVVTCPDNFAAFQDGEVLVARATAPARTPLFARAGQVVTDSGTLAAHASLVAREYGIASVVGTTDATRRLSTGIVVTVDGSAGTVVIESASRLLRELEGVKAPRCPGNLAAGFAAKQ